MSKNLFIYGTHAVLAALKNPHRTLHKLWLTKKSQETFSPFLKKVSHKIVEDKVLASFLPKGAVHQDVVLETSPLQELSLEEMVETFPEEACVVILDQVTDPQNLGAILRSCATFGANALIVSEHHSPQFEGTIAKVASGALEYVPLIRVVNMARTLEKLQENDFWCYGFAEEGKEVLGSRPLTGRIALIFGAEGEGLRRLTKEHCDGLLKLPTSSHFTTLNVAQTVAVALFEVQKKKL